MNNHLAPWLLWQRLEPGLIDANMASTLTKKLDQLPAFYDNKSKFIRYDIGSEPYIKAEGAAMVKPTHKRFVEFCALVMAGPKRIVYLSVVAEFLLPSRNTPDLGCPVDSTVSARDKWPVRSPPRESPMAHCCPHSSMMTPSGPVCRKGHHVSRHAYRHCEGAAVPIRAVF